MAILEEKGAAGLTVQAVVKRAGSSVGSFYARFEGKQDLLDYLKERIWEDAAARWEEELNAEDWRSCDLDELVDRAIRLLAAAARSRARSLKALSLASGGDSWPGPYERFLWRLVGALSQRVLDHRHDLSHPDPERAVPLGLLAAHAVLEAGFPGEDVTSEELQAEAARLLRSYLAPDRIEGAPSPGDVDFFDVWN